MQYLTEAEVANAVAEYYRRLSTAILPDEIWPDIVNGHWGTIHPLYPEPIPEVALLIDEDSSIADKLDELQSLPKEIASLGRRRSLNRQLSKHAISVRQDLLEEWQNHFGDFIIGANDEVIGRTPFPGGYFTHREWVRSTVQKRVYSLKYHMKYPGKMIMDGR